MKLLSIKNIKEGDKFPEAWIGFGRKLTPDCSYNGLYLRVTFPITRKKKTVSWIDFQTREELCNPSIYIMCRRVKTAGWTFFNSGIVWVPVDLRLI
jgi:hypothetical protein